jgi:hypothetical protein
VTLEGSSDGNVAAFVSVGWSLYRWAVLEDHWGIRWFVANVLASWERRGGIVGKDRFDGDCGWLEMNAGKGSEFLADFHRLQGHHVFEEARAG